MNRQCRPSTRRRHRDVDTADTATWLQRQGVDAGGEEGPGSANVMKPPTTASTRFLFAAAKAALAATVLSVDLARSPPITSAIPTAIIAVMAFMNSSGVMPADLKCSVAFGHFEEMAAPHPSAVWVGSLGIAFSSAFAAASMVSALTTLSILSSSSVVRGMAPAALIWSGGISARRAGTAVKTATAQIKGSNKERVSERMRIIIVGVRLVLSRAIFEDCEMMGGTVLTRP